MFDTIRWKLLNVRSYTRQGVNFSFGERVTFGGMRYKEMTNAINEIDREEYSLNKLTSASYDINYQVNLTGNFIQFEFSIPKYLYGHNVVHYPESSGNEDEDLKSFLVQFVEYEFSCQLLREDIEIQRLDFCYNYSFQSYENKVMYLTELPRLFKKHFATHLITVIRDETVYYHTQDYSFKVYDKYKEFMKHDYDKLVQSQGREKADKVAKEAKKILRFEMTMRRRKMSYEFYDNVEGCPWVSGHFRSAFRTLKRQRMEIDSILTKLASYFNRYMKDKITLFEMTVLVLSIRGHKYEKNGTEFHTYFDANFQHLFASAVALKRVEIEKEYEGGDFNGLVKRHYRQRLRRYRKMIKPKSTRADFSRYEREHTKVMTEGPELLQLDEWMMSILIGRFWRIFDLINDFEVNAEKISPLTVLYRYRSLIKDGGYKVTGLRRYLAVLNDMGEKTMKQKKVYDDRSIRRHKALIRDIETYLIGKGHNVTLTEMILPEKMDKSNYYK